MENKGERQAGHGRGDGYLDLMAAVVEQQVRDAYDTRVPGRSRPAIYYRHG
jgi:hypothetical protein